MVNPCKHLFTLLFLLSISLYSFSAISHTGNPAAVGCADIFTTNTPGTNYFWDFGPDAYPRYGTGAADTAVFLTTGSHTVTVTINTGGGPVTEQLTINVSPGTGATTLSANKPVCFTFPATTVTFTAGGGNLYVFFVNDSAYQSGPSSTFSYMIRQGDRVRAMALSGLCFNNPSPAIMDSTPQAPVLNSTILDDTICAGDRVVYTINPSAFDSVVYQVGGSSIQGSRTLTTWTTNTLSEGQIVSVYVWKNGCKSYYPTNRDTVHVKPTPQMLLAASDTVICQGTPVTFTATAQQTATDSFNFWINSARAQSGNASDRTFITSSLNNHDTVIVTGSLNGCRSLPSKAIIMTVNSISPVTLTSSDPNDTVCQGTSVTFTASPSTFGNYEFFNGGTSVQNGTSPTYITTALTNGNSIRVTATNPGCPPQNSNTISTVILPAPTVDAGSSNLSACSYAPQQTLTGFSPAGGAWTGTGITNPSGTFDPAVAGSGVHTLTYSYSDPTSGCSASDNITFTVYAAPTISISPVNPAVCRNRSIQLTASGASTYRWNQSPEISDTTIPNPTITPANTSIYTVTGTDANNCSSTASATVTVNDVTDVTFPTSPSCSGQATTFVPDQTPAGASYTWYFGDGSTSNQQSPTHTYTSGNTYTVTLITQQGICTDTTTNQVLIYPGADASFDATPLSSYVGEPIRFTNRSGGADTYEWNLGDQTTADQQSFTHSYQDPGVYTVSLKVSSNAGGCVDSLVKPDYIIIYRKPKIFIPNAFTPGSGDLNNSVLHVFADGLKYMDWKIYNRSGEKVFESNNISSETSAGWDGTYKGALAPVGVYTYTMKVVFEDNTNRDYKGSITLLR